MARANSKFVFFSLELSSRAYVRYFAFFDENEFLQLLVLFPFVTK